MASGFESASHKIVRVMEHQEALEHAIAKYRGICPYEKVTQPNAAPKLNITKQPPPLISILSGEIIYQLRSALDHLFFDLVRRKFTGPFGRKELRGIAFPLLADRPNGYETFRPVPLEAFNFPSCVNLSIEAFTLIEGLQPYHRMQEFHELMRMLHVFSNIDKHRYLQTTIAVVNRRHTIVAGGLTSTVTFAGLQDGAELDEPVHHPFSAINQHPEMEVQDEYIIEIAIDEPEFGPPQTSPIDLVMYGLPLLVWQICDGFKKLLA